METNTTTKICPRCHKAYDGYPALSRRDNKTDICSDCGTEEAFVDFACAKGKNVRSVISCREISFMKSLINL
jgi:hypothetical protein